MVWSTSRYGGTVKRDKRKRSSPSWLKSESLANEIFDLATLLTEKFDCFQHVFSKIVLMVQVSQSINTFGTDIAGMV